MVTKFISGLMKKKGEKVDSKEKKSTEDIPDELPTLADEITEEQEEKSTEDIEKVNDFKEIEEKPEEGANKVKDFEELDEKPIEKAEKVKDFEELDEKPIEKAENDSAPLQQPVDSEAIEHEKVPETKEAPVQLKPLPPEKRVEEEKKQHINNEEIVEQPIIDKKTEEGRGFFSEILSLSINQGINENILKQDLTKGMKDFWYFHPQQKGRFKNKELLRHDIINGLTELKRLEDRWTAQKAFLDEDKRSLFEKERDIKTKAEELQRTLSQLKFYEDLPAKKFFWLKNGIVIKNIYELMNLLEVMNNSTFNHHVNDNVNDFSEWIENSVGNKELAKKIGSARTREEMSIILENALIGSTYRVGSDEYFRMCNGQVIKNIKELITALKEINEPIFMTHVNEEKNDFDLWIRHVFKNEYLADRLKIAKSREDMRRPN